MPGEDFYSWSTTAATNSSADTSINWAEGQPRASVNNSARSMMATLAKHRILTSGPTIATGGTPNAQTFGSGIGYTSVPSGLRVLLFNGAGTNTGAVTLDVDGIGPRPVRTNNPAGGYDLVPGQWPLGTYAELLFDGTNWRMLAGGGGGSLIGNGDYSSGHTVSLEITGNMPVVALHNPGLHFTKFGLNSSGAFTIGGGNWSTDRFTVDATGGVTAQGNISAIGSVLANVVAVGPTHSLGLVDAGTERQLQFAADGWRLAWDTAGGRLAFFNPSIPLFTVSGTGDLGIVGFAQKPGGGPWNDSSDARIKNILGDYDSGLAAVTALNPVRYSFKGNDPAHIEAAASGKEFVGLIAQQAEQSMPELVTQTSGTIDDAPVSDLRMLDPTALTFALVNCIKELLARIEALEAKML